MFSIQHPCCGIVSVIKLLWALKAKTLLQLQARATVKRKHYMMRQRNFAIQNRKIYDRGRKFVSCVENVRFKFTSRKG
jgi:hypothetical protein